MFGMGEAGISLHVGSPLDRSSMVASWTVDSSREQLRAPGQVF